MVSSQCRARRWTKVLDSFVSLVGSYDERLPRIATTDSEQHAEFEDQRSVRADHWEATAHPRSLHARRIIRSNRCMERDVTRNNVGAPRLAARLRAPSVTAIRLAEMCTLARS